MPHDTSTPPPAVRLRGITKRFPGVVANDGVDFEAAEGEVHALLGENGAGKTTLTKILTGLYRPDEGEIELYGRAVQFDSPRDALDAGVSMVHQHFRLVEAFTVAENVVLGDHRGEARRFRLRPRAIERRVAELGEEYGLAVEPRAKIWQLSLGEQQRVEILKALYRESRVLILDEPTAVLTPQEAESLFETVRAMASEGRTIIFISHKLHEVKAVADRVTVLRAGRSIGTVSAADSTPQSLTALMVGRELGGATATESKPRDEVVLEVDGSLGGGRPRRGGGQGRVLQRSRGRDPRRRRSCRQRPARARGDDHRDAACSAGRAAGRREADRRRSAQGNPGGDRARPRGPARHGGRAEPHRRLQRRAQVLPRSRDLPRAVPAPRQHPPEGR